MNIGITLSGVLMGVGLTGILSHRGHLIMILIYLETLMLGLMNLWMVLAGSMLEAQIWIFLMMVVSAVETALSLGLMVSLLRQSHTLSTLLFDYYSEPLDIADHA